MAGLVKFAAKVGVVGGSVYYTNAIGVWGDSDQSEKAYRTIYGLVSPYLQDVPVEVPELPRITEITSTMKNYWNSGVLATGRFLLNLPNQSSSLVKEGYNSIMNQINPTEST